MSPDPNIRRPDPLAGADGTRRRRDVADFRAALEAGITDIRPTHGCVFRFLRGDGMRLTRLAASPGLTKQSVGEIVDDLTALGYVERFPDPTDRRAKLLRLTKQGQGRPGARLQPLRQGRRRWAEPFGGTRSPSSAVLEASPSPKPPAPSPRSSDPAPAIV